MSGRPPLWPGRAVLARHDLSRRVDTPLPPNDFLAACPAGWRNAMDVTTVDMEERPQRTNTDFWVMVLTGWHIVLSLASLGSVAFLWSGANAEMARLGPHYPDGGRRARCYLQQLRRCACPAPRPARPPAFPGRQLSALCGHLCSLAGFLGRVHWPGLIGRHLYQRSALSGRYLPRLVR